MSAQLVRPELVPSVAELDGAAVAIGAIPVDGAGTAVRLFVAGADMSEEPIARYRALKRAKSVLLAALLALDAETTRVSKEGELHVVSLLAIRREQDSAGEQVLHDEVPGGEPEA